MGLFVRQSRSPRMRNAHAQHAHLYVGNALQAPHTGAKGGSRGNDIIHKKHMAARFGHPLHQLKGLINVVGARPTVFVGLRFGVHDTANKPMFHL